MVCIHPSSNTEYAVRAEAGQLLLCVWYIGSPVTVRCSVDLTAGG